MYQPARVQTLERGCETCGKAKKLLEFYRSRKKLIESFAARIFE